MCANLHNSFVGRIISIVEIRRTVENVVPRTLICCNPYTTLFEPDKVAASVFTHFIDKVQTVDIDTRA